MKKVYTKHRLVWLDIVVICVTILLTVGGIFFQLTKNKYEASPCTKEGKVYEISLKQDTFSSERLTVMRCDYVKIVNKGPELYDLAFGVHEKHVSYPGFERQILAPNQYFIIDMVQAGTYTMHDHNRDNAQLDFDVREKN